MAFTRMTKDMDIISKLDDEPNDVGGLTAAQLKAEFDKAGNTVKDWLNGVLLTELEGRKGAGNIGVSAISSLTGALTVQAALEKLVTQIQEVSQGAVADGSINAGKLTDGAVTGAKLANGAVTGAKLSDGAVTAGKIAAGAVTAGKYAAGSVGTAALSGGSVTTGKLADKSVTTAKLADKAVGTEQLDELSVTSGKLFAKSVTRDKLANDAMYSPVYHVTETSYAISAADIGRTLIDAYGIRENAIVLKLTGENSRTLPQGAEIAIAWKYCKGISVEFSGVRACDPGKGLIATATKPGTVQLSDKYRMIVLKKVETDPTYGDMWLVSGNNESYTYSTTDLTAGTSALTTGRLYFVYE